MPIGQGSALTPFPVGVTLKGLGVNPRVGWGAFSGTLKGSALVFTPLGWGALGLGPFFIKGPSLPNPPGVRGALRFGLE